MRQIFNHLDYFKTKISLMMTLILIESLAITLILALLEYNVLSLKNYCV